jgi:hypothetical protein
VKTALTRKGYWRMAHCRTLDTAIIRIDYAEPDIPSSPIITANVVHVNE